MTQGPRPQGKTGQRVEDAGTYECEGRSSWSYVKGDTFLACPTTGKSTVWEKVREPEHADSR